MGFQVDRATHRILVLVKRGRQIGSQVNLTIHFFWFWLKEIAGKDLRLAQSHTNFGSG